MIDIRRGRFWCKDKRVYFEDDVETITYVASAADADLHGRRGPHSQLGSQGSLGTDGRDGVGPTVFVGSTGQPGQPDPRLDVLVPKVKAEFRKLDADVFLEKIYHPAVCVQPQPVWSETSRFPSLSAPNPMPVFLGMLAVSFYLQMWQYFICAMKSAAFCVGSRRGRKVVSIYLNFSSVFPENARLQWKYAECRRDLEEMRLSMAMPRPCFCGEEAD